MMQIVPDNAECSAGAVVRQQVMKLQQQLVDLQSSFVEEQSKAIQVILPSSTLAFTSLACLCVAAGWF